MKKAISVILCAAVLCTVSIWGAGAELISQAPEYSFDFQADYINEGYKLGTSYEDGNTFREIWTPSDGLGQNNSAFHVNGEGHKYLTLSGFLSLPCDYSWNGGYTFSADISGSNSNFSGVLFNYTQSREGFPLFENNGASADGDSLVGEAGIGVALRGGNKLEVYILTYDASAAKAVGALRQSFTTSGDLNNFNTLGFSDDGSGDIELKLDSATVCTIKYSDAGVYDDSPYIADYYKTAVIYGADGTLLGSTDSALIASCGTVGFGTRAAELNIDNIKISPVIQDSSKSTLTLDKSEYSIKDGKFSVTASFTNARAADTWFGVYRADVAAPTPADSLGTWCYANGTRAAGEEIPADGTFVMTEEVCNEISVLTDGEYKLYMFARDSGGDTYEVIASADFALVPYVAPDTSDAPIYLAAALALISLGCGIAFDKKAPTAMR